MISNRSKLACLGGEPHVASALKPYRSVGEGEIAAVNEVMRSGCLSGFFGSWESGFYGGPKIREFEAAWGERYGSKHTVSINSNTSGLHASVGAVGVGPGDEVIVAATSMSATAMAPLVYGGIPVFADLDPDTFCIDVKSVEANLTKRTRCVIAVNLFGHPAPLHELRELCDRKGIHLIEDNAQGIVSTERGKPCGTIGHIGVFSLNYHKHIHTGEGGMCTTDSDELAQRLRLIRNHAEAVVGPAGVTDLTNMVGFNLRMTELSAAVGLVQLGDIERHANARLLIGEGLTESLAGLPGITPPKVREDCTHSYYLWAARYDSATVGVSRETFVRALCAEGAPWYAGYVPPMYLLPLFRNRVAIGRDGFPFTLTDRQYNPGLCPVAERLYRNELIWFECCAHDIGHGLLDEIVGAFHKVYEGREELAAMERAAPAQALG
ncbi:MAG: DegT/DnrJ/EryC1/StrS family aminotransferase [Hyphomicrobiales bacterium]